MPRCPMLWTTVVAVFLTALLMANGHGQTNIGRAPETGSLRLLDAILRRGNGPGLLGQPKIVGGDPARPGDDPWQVALLDAGNNDARTAQFCGGSLIAPGVVVTAGHCVDRGTLASQVRVLAGTVDLGSGMAPTRVLSIHRHNRYDALTLDYDIAILRIAPDHGGTPIALVDPTREAALLTSRVRLRTTGWGATREGGPGSALLKAITPPYRTPRDCREERSHGSDVTDNMICAGEDNMAQDSCQGDSGGPLTIRAGGQPVLVGITSWGDGCGQTYKYGVYTRVARLVAWIQQNGPLP